DGRTLVRDAREQFGVRRTQPLFVPAVASTPGRRHALKNFEELVVDERTSDSNERSCRSGNSVGRLWQLVFVRSEPWRSWDARKELLAKRERLGVRHAERAPVVRHRSDQVGGVLDCEEGGTADSVADVTTQVDVKHLWNLID